MYIALLLLSVVGFLTAYTIYHEKKVKHGKKIACPLGQDCDDVVRGEYNTFLGIRNEITGMVYYGALIIIFALLAFLDIPMKPLILTVLSAAITASFLFSLYLTVIQLFTIKELCSWCFLSAIVSSIIVILWWSHVSPEFIPFLVEYKRAIVTIHLAGFALGVGGATISDTMFFSFLKDLKISKKESEVLHILSQVIWLGLGLLVLSGILLFLGDIPKYIVSTKFIAKMIVVGILTINGIALNLIIAPRLIDISFGRPHKHRKGELHQYRKFAYAAGAISLISWYTAFILGMFRSLSLSVITILGIYVVVLLIGILLSQLLEKYFGNRKMIHN